MNGQNNFNKSAMEATAPEHDSPAFAGKLETCGQTYPVAVEYASRYSLWLTYTESLPQEPTGPVDSLTFATEKHTITVGPCRIIQDQSPTDDQYRLVPMASIHDFEKLFFRERADVLDLTARNLPLILQYRQSIDPRFQSFAADVSYDMSVYKELFDRLDGEYAGEPEHIRAIIQQGIIENLGGDFIRCLDGHVQEMETIIADYTSDQHSQHGYYLRKQLWSDLLRAPFMARTNLKPRGYIGDSEMMQMCYRNTYEGDSTFGKLLHHHPVASAAAQAVRNRRPLVAELAGKCADRIGATADNRMRLLSVACGPALEMENLLTTREDCERVECSLLDQDEQALGEAESVLNGVEQRLEASVSVNFIRESVRTLLATRTLRERWGTFHFIYSMGLFDYLTPPVAKAVLTKLHALLRPGGEISIGNFHVNNPTKSYMDYWLDWPLYYRTEGEFLALAEEFDDSQCWVEYDDTGVQMLLRIRKANT